MNRTDAFVDPAADHEAKQEGKHAAPQDNETAIGASLPHESAALHVSGEATYTDDIPELQGTLHAALGLSRHAHARIVSLDLDAVRKAPGVIAVLSAEDIPGENNCGPVLHDDPILAADEVLYLGQPVFAVIAESHDLARRAAALAKSDDVIRYEPLEAILTPADAKAAKQFVLPPLHLKRGDPEAKIAAAPNRISGRFEVGGQEQFYLEGQSPTRCRRKWTACSSIVRRSIRAKCSRWSRTCSAGPRITWCANAGAWAAASAARNRNRRCSRAWRRSRRNCCAARSNCAPIATTIS